MRMKQICLAVVLMIILCGCAREMAVVPEAEPLQGCEENLETEDVQEQNIEIYKVVLDEFDVLQGYCFFDLNHDGSDEMIAKTGVCEADYKYLFYSLSESNAIQIGEESAGHSYLVSDGEDLIISGGQMGYEWAYRILYDGETFQSREMFSRDIGDGDYTQWAQTIELIVPEVAGTLETVPDVAAAVEEKEKIFIHFPETWEGLVTQKKFETDVSYGITINHRPSEELGYGGTLFSVRLQPVTEPYNPDHGFECFGTLTDPVGNVENLIVFRPTDVQFSEQTMASYKALKKQIPEVLASMTFADGYTFQRTQEKNEEMTDMPADTGAETGAITLELADYSAVDGTQPLFAEIPEDLRKLILDFQMELMVYVAENCVGKAEWWADAEPNVWGHGSPNFYWVGLLTEENYAEKMAHAKQVTNNLYQKHGWDIEREYGTLKIGLYISDAFELYYCYRD